MTRYWYKYRYIYKGGIGGDYDYIETYDETQINELFGGFDEMLNDYGILPCGDYYHVEYEVIEKPPVEWIENKINFMKSHILSLNKSITNYNALLHSGEIE